MGSYPSPSRRHRTLPHPAPDRSIYVGYPENQINSEARRKIAEGAVEVGGTKITDESAKVKLAKGSLVRLGKRFLKIE